MTEKPNLWDKTDWGAPGVTEFIKYATPIVIDFFEDNTELEDDIFAKLISSLSEVTSHIWGDSQNTGIKARITELKEEVVKREDAYKVDFEAKYEPIRQFRLAIQSVYDEYLYLTWQSEQLQDLLAIITAKYEESAERLEEFSLPEIGNLRLKASTKVDLDWQNTQKLPGVGGSNVNDVAKAMLKDLRTNEWILKNTKTATGVLNERLDPEIPEDYAPDEWQGYVGALGRGNALEPSIIRKVQKLHPDERIVKPPLTYADAEFPELKVRFDALFVDGAGRPVKILEVKTSVNPDDWGEANTGAKGVPERYLAQLGQYMLLSNIHSAEIVALINCQDLRRYEVNLADIEILAQKNLDACKSFVKIMRDYRKKGVTKAEIPIERFISDPFQGAEKLGNAEKLAQIYDEAAKYRGISSDDVREEFLEACKKGNIGPGSARGKLLNILTNLYLPRAGEKSLPIIAVDVETTGMAGSGGYVIDLGAMLYSGEGKREKLIDELYALPEKVMTTVDEELPFFETHNITKSMIERKPVFHELSTENPAKQMLFEKNERDYTLLLAHNASFEINCFKLFVEGFADAIKQGKIKVIDTMYLSRRLDIANRKQPYVDDTCDSYAHRWGSLNANQSELHRGEDDARIMAEAYFAQRKFLSRN